MGHTQASLCDRPCPPCPSIHLPDQARWISTREPLPRVAASPLSFPEMFHAPELSFFTATVWCVPPLSVL